MGDVVRRVPSVERRLAELGREVAELRGVTLQRVAAHGARHAAGGGDPVSPTIVSGRTPITFDNNNTAVATLVFGITFAAPPRVVAMLEGGGTTQFTTRIGAVSTTQVAIRANTHTGSNISATYDVNWVAVL